MVVQRVMIDDLGSPYALVALVFSTLVGPVVGWLIGRRRETADIRQQEAARVESIVSALSAVVDQLQDENRRLAEANADLWRRALEHQERYEQQATALADVRARLADLQRQAGGAGA